jgi:hypothetical protein
MLQRMHIRLFCYTDDSELGRAGLAFCDYLAERHSVRLVSLNQFALFDGKSGDWQRHAPLTTTPMLGEYVNFVCGTPDDLLKIHSSFGLGNVALLVADAHLKFPANDLRRALDRYQMVYTLTTADAERIDNVLEIAMMPITESSLVAA